MHTFLGICVPEELQMRLCSLSEEIRPVTPFKKWTNPKDAHITLAFLGETTSEQIIKINKYMEDAPLGDSFALTSEGLGIFGNPATPRVLYADVSFSQPLQDVQCLITNGCMEAGFSLDRKPFRPHITIAKAFDNQHPNQWNPNILKSEQFLWDAFKFHVNQIHLFEIHPKSEKKYKTIKTWELK